MMAESVQLKIIQLPENQGHGNARRASLAGCHNNLVALMDADDISVRNRFEKQLALFVHDPELKAVGGQITEFIEKADNIIGKRLVPENDADIKAYMKKRCPMNQVSVMMKKDFAESVGGYVDWYCEEDYYLWIRMAMAGGKFANVPETLVNVRVGDQMSARRGGWKYFSSEAKLQKYMLDVGIIGLPRFFYNVAIRFGGEVLLSSKMRTKLFRLLRAEVTVQAEPICASTPSQKYPPFSVAMCVYGGDNAQWFDEALGSIIDQTVPPDEIVLVVDGPVPGAIECVIEKYRRMCTGLT